MSANRIASLTRVKLSKRGVDTKVWAPHSTRGAGLNLYRSLGLSWEKTAQIGHWKNAQAFRDHYQRLGAEQAAGEVIERALGGMSVHSVPSGTVVELDTSRTPGSGNEPGRREGESGTQGTDETTLLSPASVQE